MAVETLRYEEKDSYEYDERGIPRAPPVYKKSINTLSWMSALEKFGNICREGQRIMVEFKLKNILYGDPDIVGKKEYIYFVATKLRDGNFRKDMLTFYSPQNSWDYSCAPND